MGRSQHRRVDASGSVREDGLEEASRDRSTASIGLVDELDVLVALLLMIVLGLLLILLF